MSTNQVRKPAGSEGSPEAGKHSSLVRQMGSRDGAWNPDPDDQIIGTLRDDVELSPNETKLIAYVKYCCVRHKRGGRSAWGKTEEGEPLTLSRIAARFGWDLSNASKHAKRPLEWGFVRVREGVFGLGADVRGTAEEGRRTKGERPNSVVCTYHLPNYVFDDIKRLSPEKRDLFLTEWAHLDKSAKVWLADAADAVRKREFEKKNNLCQRFGTALRKGKEQRVERPPTIQLSFSDEDLNGYVHTSNDERYVHTENAGLYTPKNGSVQTGPSLYSSEVSESSELASADAPENELLEEALLNVIGRSRLQVVGGKKLDPRTVHVMRGHLQRLPERDDVKDVLDVLEDKCRYLAQRDSEAKKKTWGWVVGVVKGEVQTRVDEGPSASDLQDQLRSAAATNGMRIGSALQHRTPQPKRDNEAAETEDNVWGLIKAQLARTLTTSAYANWISRTKLASFADGQVLVAVPDETTQRWIEQEYATEISSAIQVLKLAVRGITYEVRDQAQKAGQR